MNQEEVIVRVKMSDAGQPGLESIRELYLRSPDGDEVLLTEVVSLTTKIGYSQIRREDGLRQVSVTADVDKSITTTNADTRDGGKNHRATGQGEVRHRYRFQGQGR